MSIVTIDRLPYPPCAGSSFGLMRCDADDPARRLVPAQEVTARPMLFFTPTWLCCSLIERINLGYGVCAAARKPTASVILLSVQASEIRGLMDAQGAPLPHCDRPNLGYCLGSKPCVCRSVQVRLHAPPPHETRQT